MSSTHQSEAQAVDAGRRRILRMAAGCAAGLFSAPLLAVPTREKDRKIALFNTHTGESLQAVYRANGKYVPETLREINRILRDHRNDKVSRIDPDLLDQLYNLRKKFDSGKPFHIISGYRSPESNAEMHENSSGVAKRSLHLEGRAIDVRLPGIKLSQLKRAALAMKQGGVGYYPKSDFVHLDTGKVRTW